jgi:hypothetical protein
MLYTNSGTYRLSYDVPDVILINFLEFPSRGVISGFMEREEKSELRIIKLKYMEAVWTIQKEENIRARMSSRSSKSSELSREGVSCLMMCFNGRK